MAGGVPMSAEATGLGVTLTHGPSGARVETQPPADNGGTGAAFSPTDLLGASLLSCALTTMALAATREGWPWGAASGRVEKHMQASPRRVAQLDLVLVMPRQLPAALRSKAEEIARTCPVARSLSPEVLLPMKFVYPD